MGTTKHAFNLPEMKASSMPVFKTREIAGLEMKLASTDKHSTTNANKNAEMIKAVSAVVNGRIEFSMLKMLRKPN